MTGRWPWFEKLCTTGKELVNGGHESKKEINAKIKNLMEKWDKLKKLAATRKTKIEDGIEAHQVYCFTPCQICDGILLSSPGFPFVHLYIHFAGTQKHFEGLMNVRFNISHHALYCSCLYLYSAACFDIHCELYLQSRLFV